MASWRKLRAFANRARFFALLEWWRQGFPMPAPAFVKQMVLGRHAPTDVTWIETGTYLGDTTAFLAGRSKKVISIEPSLSLFEEATKRFKDTTNIQLLHGLSEYCLPDIVVQTEGNVAFWLDGHYSAGVTFKGPVDTPVMTELTAIGDSLPRWQKVAVFVDDIRMFDPSLDRCQDYPHRHVLVDWAKKHRLNWTIEHDIFIAKNFL